MRFQQAFLAAAVGLMGLTFGGESAASDLVEEGAVLFEVHCLACHGADAAGLPDNGKDIRGMPDSRVKRAVRGLDQMPEIDITREERQKIVAFLASLSK